MKQRRPYGSVMKQRCAYKSVMKQRCAYRSVMKESIMKIVGEQQIVRLGVSGSRDVQ